MEKDVGKQIFDEFQNRVGRRFIWFIWFIVFVAIWIGFGWWGFVLGVAGGYGIYRLFKKQYKVVW